jgi:hypothetical protein
MHALTQSRDIAQALGSAELDGHGQYGRPNGPPHGSNVPPPFICSWEDLNCRDNSDMQHRQEFVVPPDDLTGT